MEDWQGCLSPECQVALVQARDGVHQRGGSVVTAEDYLLALLESCTSVTAFLHRAGVDLDELVRTVQCEQPVVTEVGREGFLSSQLLAWFAEAREVCDQSWLDWSVLLRVLVSGMERLRDKAYVAVLEVVVTWPDATALLPHDASKDPSVPLVVTDSDWLLVAEDITVSLASSPQSLVWLTGVRGAGKSSLLQFALGELALDHRVVNPRTDQNLFELARCQESEGTDSLASASVLVLDNCSPADLMVLVERTETQLLDVLASWQGPILLVGNSSSPADCSRLEHWLGRLIDVIDTPSTSAGQKEAILVAHQPLIEKRWQIEIPVSVIRYAASCRDPSVMWPGDLLRWVERAAARLDLFARRGSGESMAMSGQLESLRRQALLELARREPASAIAASLDELQLSKAAVEVAWFERKAAGTLRHLSVDDLSSELARWVAAKR
ncbi:hypothetical protein QVZ43_13295 [Marinobacter sp. chi1]|uniref:Clp R domain-containing protein n=1 Tax=Marinobacter suaedae TaxID=3057675 RepID=A0ABT8W367_9GAMM|nr:hypothetical protein [Marinobacter sp. chi1]MDO3722695.1 hypothetical protein [Marinobacter sp. chi1]